LRHISGIDHCVLLVRDLDKTERDMARLGFRPTPRGYHSAHMGTANATVVFRDGTYFETLGVVAETAYNEATRVELARREGIYGIALKTDDARGAAVEFAAAGLGPPEAVDFVRPVELPGGPQDAAFTVARTQASAFPAAWLFACQQHTPAVVWREDYLDQPNGVVGLAEVVGVADDLAAIARAYGPLFGGRASEEADRVAIATGTAALSFLTPTALALRYGVTRAGTPPSLVALRFTVADLAAAERLLRERGVAVRSSPSGTLLIPPEEACGALLELAA
jgi:hypothetical protein